MSCQRCGAADRRMARHHPTGRCPECTAYFDPRLVLVQCSDCHRVEHKARTVLGLGDRYPRFAQPSLLRGHRARLALHLGVLDAAPAGVPRALAALAADPECALGPDREPGQ
jgi:hypothetical protein